MRIFILVIFFCIFFSSCSVIRKETIYKGNIDGKLYTMVLNKDNTGYLINNNDSIPFKYYAEKEPVLLKGKKRRLYIYRFGIDRSKYPKAPYLGFIQYRRDPNLHGNNFVVFIKQ
ncbi:hypothetical protein [Aureivirga sp. CE67]|uniref:hypothetical protein n=1 Tax=Aureivirga sp. CE67 TaxID=1788983 RepID=UPI0018CA4643|nr:hypothetical protein [Aureivirga sp. CE67]